MMSEEQKDLIEAQNWRPKVMIIGGFIGALVGVGAAYLLIKTSQDNDRPPEISAGEGVKLAVLVMGLLRSIATLGE